MNNEPKPIEQQGQEYADSLMKIVEASGVQTEISNPVDSFLSGCYFGAVQGYKRGVNHMLTEIPKYLPEIYNKIVESGHDMKVDWVKEFRELLFKNMFGV